MDVVFQTSGAQQEPEQDIVVIVETEVTNTWNWKFFWWYEFEG